MNTSGIFRYVHPLILILFFGIALFTTSAHIHATTSSIILSEIQITGGSGHTNDEFVELYNAGKSDQILTHWELRRKTQGDNTSPRGTLFHTFEGNLTLPAGKYFLWTNKDGVADFTNLFDVQSKNKTSPNLSDDNSLGLYDDTDVLIDSITWGSGHKSPFSPSTLYSGNPSGNKSLIRNIDTLIVSLSETPSPTNSRGETYSPTPEPMPLPTPVPAPTTPVKNVHLNEIFANPLGDENAGEFIELYNEDTAPADISGFIIYDASKTGDYTFSPGTTIPGQGYFVLLRSISKLALNNSNETLSLYDTANSLIDSMTYQKTKENISLNYSISGWRGGTPTPGTANILNSLPETKKKVPTKGYRGVAIAMSARGQDADGDSLKYTWDFGDGHKSYKKETSHKYEDNGTYQVILTTSDGSDDVVETFIIKIESFPEKEVRITSFVPNPEGKDTEGEYLIVENREKKPINLKGFSIATGWKKLINHPVRSDFTIAGKSQAKLTRDFSLFTLPNEKGKIELRGPDGKTLQKIKYNVVGGIKDDAVYKKEKGKRWEWQETAPDNQDEDLQTAPESETADTEPVLLAPESTPDDPIEDIPDTPTEPKKLSLLPLLNYGTSVTVPESIVLTFDDPDLSTAVTEREHYAITFTKAVLSDLNATLNRIQNKE
ncbi:MAG: lamin tail domain-containing protein [Candidatus Moranbacteria bacterium]|nr:lamin tail domain-containing protein [Candidatus Moranbacteria bacterium]